MILQELFNPTVSGYQDLEDDNTQLTVSDLRKTRLTLKQISKLRQMNDIRAVEHKNNMEKVKAQYSTPSEEGMPPAF